MTEVDAWRRPIDCLATGAGAALEGPHEPRNGSRRGFPNEERALPSGRMGSRAGTQGLTLPVRSWWARRGCRPGPLTRRTGHAASPSPREGTRPTDCPTAVSRLTGRPLHPPRVASRLQADPSPHLWRPFPQGRRRLLRPLRHHLGPLRALPCRLPPHGSSHGPLRPRAQGRRA